MKQWDPKDILAMGLLGFVVLYTILLFILSLIGEVSDAGGARSKEIMIYIIGVLSGYIGNRVIKNGREK